ncbi:unnamed protein product [Rhizoctonia solani]|uniref:Uncharacterized protein n=1 Tax=Rhizoctonia solani TaxID=456999 RepID=A0A8H2WY70_9AGAM|nr:unnamed protein product [Rhizoctonia solani]
MPHVFASAHITKTFTFDGTNLLYGKFPRVDVKNLRHLLVRGSGCVVRGYCMPKAWFQAQCAHYGLPTSGTLAALRNHLELFVTSPLPQVPRDLVILEKQKRNEYASAVAALSLKNDVTADQSRDKTDKTEEWIASELLDNASGAELNIPAQTAEPFAESHSAPTTKSPRKLSLPRAKIIAVAKFQKSVRWDPALAESALQEIRIRMGPAEPSSETDTDSEVESDRFTSSRVGMLAPQFARRSLACWPPRNLVPLTADVVSGRWELSVTSHTVSPLPMPWRTASSKWLKGDMNVQLSGDGRSLTGEFVFLGLDGKFKSRKCHLRDDGIGAWVQFVAQMPIATTKPIRYQGHKEHSLTFGPSETQYGYLRFYGGNRVGGMLRCRKYGKLEFGGIRRDGPVDMVSDWKSFVE